jgi:uncharacterized protein YegP (UPF0339 family)
MIHFRLYRDIAGYYRWTFYAANNRKVADSAEGYANKADCVAGINLIVGSAGAPIYE